MAEITSVAVIGAGTTGSRIGLQTAYAGRHQVALVDSSLEQLEKARPLQQHLTRRAVGRLTGGAGDRRAGPAGRAR
jgi:3-hydroxyacyl-CoA dehydrogenase